MFDYLKAYIYDRDFAAKLQSNSMLNFYTPFNEVNGDFKNSIYVAKFQDLEFKVFPKGRVELKGSLHKYYNLGEHNYNDFDITQLNNVLQELNELFGIDETKWRINHIEFGVNIKTSIATKDILENLIVYKFHPFSNISVPSDGTYKRCDLRQYSIKMYDKGSQFDLPDSILRIEKKVYKMECVRKTATYLSDLRDPGFWAHCLQNLVTSTKQIIITEDINEKILTGVQKEQFRECINPQLWKKMTPKKRHKYRSFFRKLLMSFGTQNYLNRLVEMVSEKGNQLKSPKKG